MAFVTVVVLPSHLGITHERLADTTQGFASVLVLVYIFISELDLDRIGERERHGGEKVDFVCFSGPPGVRVPFQ
jgi:hypothetical protein